MQKILIVEDDKTQIKDLYTNIQLKYPNWIIFCACNYQEAKKLITQSVKEDNIFTLFLLDVQLDISNPNDVGGFELANDILSYPIYYQTNILFLTSITDKIQYALSNYHCYDYISKPYTTDEIIIVLNQMLMRGYLSKNSISITDTNQVQYQILFKEFYFAETKSHQIIIYTATGKIITRQATLASLQKELPNHFLQCHRKYLVNMNHVTNYDKTKRCLTIHNYTLSVGRTYKEAFEKMLKKQKPEET